MKLIFLLVVFVAAVWCVVSAARAGLRLLARRREARRRRDARWEVDEHSDGEFHNVYAVRNLDSPTEEKLLVGGVPFAHGNFEQEIELVRVKALDRVTALNHKIMVRR